MRAVTSLINDPFYDRVPWKYGFLLRCTEMPPYKETVLSRNTVVKRAILMILRPVFLRTIIRTVPFDLVRHEVEAPEPLFEGCQFLRVCMHPYRSIYPRSKDFRTLYSHP